jgi:hypothetical protein
MVLISCHLEISTDDPEVPLHGRATAHHGSMPRPRRPLPDQLLKAPFSRSEALALGVPAYRLEAPDIESLGRGLYAHRHLMDRWPSGHETPGHLLGPRAVAALCRHYPGSVVSHATSAHVFRLPLPRLLLREPRIHLTWFDGAAPAQRRGVISHRSPLQELDRTTVHRIPVTSPARTWVDLAGDSRVDDTELVVLADAIVKRPWARGPREDGLDTLRGLSEAIARAGSVKGIRRARAALRLTRVGADSPPETRARLALVGAGLPEPGVQVRADPDDPYSPVADLGYPGLKIAIQYDGKHHRTPQQQAADAYRDEAFQRRGWTVVRLTWLDQQQGFARLVALVRERLGTSA